MFGEFMAYVLYISGEVNKIYIEQQKHALILNNLNPNTHIPARKMIEQTLSLLIIVYLSISGLLDA